MPAGYASRLVVVWYFPLAAPLAFLRAAADLVGPALMVRMALVVVTVRPRRTLNDDDRAAAAGAGAPALVVVVVVANPALGEDGLVPIHIGFDAVVGARLGHAVVAVGDLVHAVERHVP